MTSQESKTCPDCGEGKPLEAFYVDRRSKTGRITYCKPCFDARNRASQKRRYDANPEAMRAQWRQQQLGTSAAKSKRWREHHREQWLEIKRRHREKYRDKIAAAWARYYEENREELLAKRRANYDPDRKRLSRTAEQADRARAKRRARKAGVPHEPWTRQEIFDRDGGFCMECGVDCSTVPWEIDHVVPLNPGPDLKWNLQLLCLTCNRRKWRRGGEPKPPATSSEPVMT